MSFKVGFTRDSIRPWSDVSHGFGLLDAKCPSLVPRSGINLEVLDYCERRGLQCYFLASGRTDAGSLSRSGGFPEMIHEVGDEDLRDGPEIEEATWRRLRCLSHLTCTFWTVAIRPNVTANPMEIGLF